MSDQKWWQAFMASDRVAAQHNAPNGYEPTPTIGSVVAAVLVGAMLGGTLTAVQIGFGNLTPLSIERILQGLLPLLFIIGLPATVIWLVGIVALGGPLWLMLHRCKATGWRTAAIVGAVLPALFLIALDTNGFGMIPRRPASNLVSDAYGLTMVNGVRTAHGWRRAIVSWLMISANGALVALAIRWIAYRTWMRRGRHDANAAP